jgi:hypothetical protein
VNGNQIELGQQTDGACQAPTAHPIHLKKKKEEEEEEKKIICLLPAALREVGGTGWGWGAGLESPDVFQTIGSQPALGNLALQANCLLCTWDSCFCISGFPAVWYPCTERQRARVSSA